MHTEISLHELEVAILHALKPLPAQLNERTVEFLVKKKHVPEDVVHKCIQHYYTEHPNDLRGCKPVPKKAPKKAHRKAALSVAASVSFQCGHRAPASSGSHRRRHGARGRRASLQLWPVPRV